MGDHVFVGERAVVNAAIVGSYIYIGKNAVIVRIDISCANIRIYSYISTQRERERIVSALSTTQGRRCVLKDCCYIEDGAVVPPETVVPSFTRFAGNPAKCVEDLPKCTLDLMLEFTKNYYQHFLPSTA